MENIILGAGITGLAAGWKTGYPIYEALREPGGICRSYYKNGYRFEVGGGHWIFGDPGIIKFINNISSLDEHHRNAGVFIDQMFSYPLQTFLMKDEEEIEKGTMKDWLYKNFGVAQCNLFFFPFNKKYTNGLYEKVIQENPHKTPRPYSKGYNDVFYYPKEGLDVFIDKFASDQEIYYGKVVSSIDVKRRVVHFLDGEAVEYKNIISTLPLSTTLNLAGFGNAFLPSVKVLVLNIGAIRGAECPLNHWIYLPYTSPAFRIGFYSNVDKSFAPDGKISIYVERAVKQDEIIDKTTYIKEISLFLHKNKWIEYPETFDCTTINPAYTYIYRNKQVVQTYIDLLKKEGIHSLGRYGKWKFQGIAESIQDGLDA